MWVWRREGSMLCPWTWPNEGRLSPDLGLSTAPWLFFLLGHALMYSHNDFSLISTFHPIVVFCKSSHFRPINVIFLLYGWLSEPFTEVISHLQTISEPKNVRSHPITRLQSGGFLHMCSWHPKGPSVKPPREETNIIPDTRRREKESPFCSSVYLILMFLQCVLDFIAQLQLFRGEALLELGGQTFGQVPKFNIMLDLRYVLSKTVGN